MVSVKQQKTCLVTGANSGLGKEIAIGLAKAGEHVIMVCRDEQRGRVARDEICNASGAEAIDLLIADLSSRESIEKLIVRIHEQYSALHVLVNNAGAVFTKKSFNSEGEEMTLAINYLGPLRLTLGLQALLIKSAPARIINVSSAIHKWAKLDMGDMNYEKRRYHFMKAYAQSKLLLNIMTFKNAKELEGTGVTVNCVHPGAVKTALGSGNANNIFLKLIDRMIKYFFLTPAQAAKPIVTMALMPEFENVTGRYFVKGKVAKS